MTVAEGDAKGERGGQMKCEKCNSEFTVKEQAKTKGWCPSCGVKIPASDYCSGVPDRRWWRLFRDAPLYLKISVLSQSRPPTRYACGRIDEDNFCSLRISSPTYARFR